MTEPPSEGSSTRVFLNGEPVVVFNVDGELHAVDDLCTHAGSSLSDGGVRDGVLRCPRHGAKFDLETGEPLDAPANPAADALEVYDVTVDDGELEVERRTDS